MKVDRRSFVKGGALAVLGAGLKRAGRAAIRYFWKDPRFRPSLRNLTDHSVR